MYRMHKIIAMLASRNILRVVLDCYVNCDVGHFHDVVLHVIRDIPSFPQFVITHM